MAGKYLENEKIFFLEERKTEMGKEENIWILLDWTCRASDGRGAGPPPHFFAGPLMTVQICTVSTIAHNRRQPPMFLHSWLNSQDGGEDSEIWC